VYFQQRGERSAGAGETLLILHGFPESSYSFHKVVDGLARRFARVVLFDMPGYGLSDKPESGYGYSLFEQADVALQLWRLLGIDGGHLLAHDMGDSVATELVARQVSETLPAGFDGFRSVTFTNGSMVLELARLRATQRLLLTRAGPWVSRLFNFRTFSQQVHSAHGTDGLGESDLQLMWENICLQDGQRKNHLSIRYIEDRKRFERSRWLPALARIAVPVHLCWGDADAVARVAMADYLKEQVCRNAILTKMPGVGHFCQLSDPETWLERTGAFFERIRAAK
jgi:pimeloyl-ACP methyl ester carboxylesterase